MLLPLLTEAEEATNTAISAIDPINKLVPFLGEFNIWTILIRLALAFVIGALFGFERSRKRHTAGFRTFTFVALFSTIAALVDLYLTINYGELFPAITAAVVLGGAIISGNTLLYSSKNQIKGLTTAVALWLTGIIGAALGAGLYTTALIGVVLAFITLSAMPKIEFYMKNKSNPSEENFVYAYSLHV